MPAPAQPPPSTEPLPPPPPHRRVALAVVLLLAGGAVGGIQLGHLVGEGDRHALQTEVERYGEGHLTALQRVVEAAAGQVEAVAAFYESSSLVERDEFRTYAGRLLERRADVQALEWIPRVRREERARVEARARADGPPGFEFRERDAGGRLVPAGDRPEYFPVLYVEPLAGNEAAAGFDLASNPVRRAALEASRASGLITATARIRLVQETGRQFGFLLFRPVGLARGRRGPDDGLQGFALGVFRAGDLLEHSLAGMSRPGLEVHLYDDTAPGPERFLAAAEGVAGPPGTPPVLHAEEDEADVARRAWAGGTVAVADRRWRAYYLPSPELLTAGPGWRAWAAGLGVLLVAALLAGYVLLNAARVERATRHAAESLAARRRLEAEIAETRRLEGELRQAQKLEAVGRLASGIAHEINTPIQFIGDNTRFFADAFGSLLALIRELVAASDPARRPELERLAEEADLAYLEVQVPQSIHGTMGGVKRVAAVVRAMREFAHPDRHELAEVDLNASLRATLEIARNEYKYVADVETDLGEVPQVACRAGELNQVFLNVLVNAAHAVGDVFQATGRRGTIRVATRQVGEAVEVAISDTGPGIPAAARDKIFDHFFTTKEVGRGTGQGLSISRAIVARHAGTITFDTADGVGTTFRIRLPIRPPAPAARPGEAAAPAAPLSRP